MSSIFDINSFDIKRDCAIEASAGTGKTYSIRKITSKLLNTDERLDNNGIKVIDKILIVTFTEKAVGELKDRIRKEIKEANISANLDRLEIYTFHSFCQNVIKEYSFLLNTPTGLKLIGSDVIDNYIDLKLRDLIYERNIVIKKIKDFTNNVKNICKNLYLDDNNEEVKEVLITDSVNPLSTFQSKLNSLFFKCKTIDDVENVILNLDSEYGTKLKKCYQDIIKGNPDLEKRKDIKKEADTLSNDKTRQKVYKEANKDSLFSIDILENCLKKKCFDYDGRVFKETYLSSKGWEFLKELKSENVDYFELEVELAKIIYSNFKEYKLVKRYQTYDDMIRAVREGVLNNDTLVKYLREKYTYAIIDEFQDTNQLQWDIFKKIFLDSDDNNIIVVGDPKQSIFSFQGADNYVYKKAVSEIEKRGVVFHLDTNYRSSNSMVNGYNALFKTDAFSSLEYQDVKVNSSLKALYLNDNNVYEEIPAISLANGDCVSIESYSKYVINTVIDYATKINGKTKLLLVENGVERNVTFKDFTFLVRKRKDFIVYRNLLESLGIPYLFVKDNSLFNGYEASHFLTLFEAITAPDFTDSNRKLYRKLMFTKFFGFTLDEISRPYFDYDDTKEMNLVRSWISLLKERRYGELFDSIYLDSYLASNLAGLNDMQSYAKFKQIGDFALEYLYSGKSIYDLIENLNTKKGLDEDNANVVGKSTDFDAIRVMTIHSSKGLDANIVVMCDISKKEKLSRQFYHKEEDGKCYRVLTTDTKKGEEEAINELERLYYVAYTRAKYKLIIPALCDINVTMIDDVEGRTDLFSFPDLTNQFIAKDAKDKVKAILNPNSNSEEIDEGIQLEKNKALINNKFTKASYKHSYSSLSHGHDDNVTITDDGVKIKDDDEANESLEKFDSKAKQILACYKDVEDIIEPADFPKGSVIGTTLHEIFEKFEFTTIDSSNNLDDLIIEVFKNNGYRIDLDKPLHQEYLEYVKGMVKRVLHADLPVIEGNSGKDKVFKLLELKEEDRKAEAEFNFSILYDKTDTKRLMNNYCNGFIDLLFKRGEYYSILDWKSDKKKDDVTLDSFVSYSDPTVLKKHVDEAYSIQRVLYSYTLIKWLKNFYNETEEEIFNNHFGGIYYVFLRGCVEDSGNGIYAQTWNSYEDLKKAFNYITKCKMKGAYNDK